MLTNLSKDSVLRNLSNIPGWRTSRRIVVFESDDWGTIRTSNVEAVKRLEAKGIDFSSLDARRYSFNDTLASTDDLEALFEVLSSVKDKNGHPAVFSAISLVANPDFDAIRSSGFEEYHYEPFTKTLKRFPGCEESFQLWKRGINEGIFIPQFHGREHLNVTAWMLALRAGHKETLEVFNEGMWGYVNSFHDGRKVNYQEAFNIHDPNEIPCLRDILFDGLNLFEQLFGYRARLFVPPNGEVTNQLESTLARNGITCISQPKIQKEAMGFGKKKKVFHYLGQKNKWGQIAITRNCFFEPGSTEKNNWVDSCIQQIELAFRWNKPAIISTHRVNYIGGLNPLNRETGLTQLSALLSTILRKWPGVEFLSSDQLGDLILKNGKV